MRTNMRRAGLLVLPLALLAISEARAEWVTVEMTAEVNNVYDPSSILAGTVAAGDIIQGTYTYDTDTPDAEPSPELGNYSHPLGTPVGFDLTVGVQHFLSDPDNSQFSMTIANLVDMDGYHVMSNGNLLPLASGAPVHEIVVDLMDPSATAHDSDLLMATAPDLSRYQDRGMYIGGASPDGADMFRIDATVTSIGGSAKVAAPGQVTYNVTARVADLYDPQNLLGGAVTVGSPVSGSYTIRTDVADSDPYADGGTYTQPLVAGLGFNLTANGIPLRSASEEMPVDVRVENQSYGPDVYKVYSPANVPLPNGARLDAIDLELHDMEGSILDSDALNADLPLLSGYEMRDLFFYGMSADGAAWYQFRAEILSIEIDDGALFKVSPPAAVYDRDQRFALALIFDSGVQPESISGSLNGADITSYINGSECQPGAPNDQDRLTLVCPYFSNNLTTGRNDLEVSVVVDGQLLTDSVTYDLIGY